MLCDSLELDCHPFSTLFTRVPLLLKKRKLYPFYEIPHFKMTPSLKGVFHTVQYMRRLGVYKIFMKKTHKL